MVEKSEYYIGSTNGKNKLHVIMWQPVAGTKAILQISHGMSEYIDRYDRFATFMASHGILVIGNDHLGHGESVKDKDELGYFPTKALSKTVVDDLYKVSTRIRARYPDVPFFLMGHSMGSFLARRYMMTSAGRDHYHGYRGTAAAYAEGCTDTGKDYRHGQGGQASQRDYAETGFWII